MFLPYRPTPSKNSLPISSKVAVKLTSTKLASGAFLAGIVITACSLFTWTNQPAQAQTKSVAQSVSTAQPAPLAQLAPAKIAAPTATTSQASTFNPEIIVLTAIPPRLGDNGELVANPGETIQASLRVRNSSDVPVTVLSLIQDFVIGDDGTTPVAVESEVSNRWSLAAWSKLASPTQLLNPGQAGTVNLVITVPQDALPGGHYAMVTHQPDFNPTGSGQGGDSNSRIAQKVGTLLYFRVKGPINEEAFLRNFTLPKLTELGPVPYSFTVENVSDVHLKPQLNLEIFNIFGRRVDQVTLESKNIFPFTPRKFSGHWNRVWGIGPYTARLTMSYGQAGSVVVTSARFWLIPIKLVLAGVVLLLVMIAAMIIIRRHLHHRLSEDQKRIVALEKKLAEIAAADKESSKNTQEIE